MDALLHQSITSLSRLILHKEVDLIETWGFRDPFLLVGSWFESLDDLPFKGHGLDILVKLILSVVEEGFLLVRVIVGQPILILNFTFFLRWHLLSYYYLFVNVLGRLLAQHLSLYSIIGIILLLLLPQ